MILQHPAVWEVSVMGVSDPKFGKGIKAVCVLNPDMDLQEQELKDFVGSKIAGYKKPCYVDFVDTLPKNQEVQ